MPLGDGQAAVADGIDAAVGRGPERTAGLAHHLPDGVVAQPVAMVAVFPVAVAEDARDAVAAGGEPQIALVIDQQGAQAGIGQAIGGADLLPAGRLLDDEAVIGLGNQGLGDQGLGNQELGDQGLGVARGEAHGA